MILFLFLLASNRFAFHRKLLAVPDEVLPKTNVRVKEKYIKKTLNRAR